MFRLIPFALAAFSLSGCAQNLLVTVDGYAAPDAPAPGTYYLSSGSSRVAENDLQFISFAATLDNTLAAKGWHRTPERKSAVTLIRFRYAVSDPVSSVREYETPEYGVTGYRMDSVASSHVVNGQTVATRQTVMTPAYGQTGVSRRVDARLLYGMSVVVEAYDLTKQKGDEAPPQVWKTLINTTDEKGDLRAMLPRLIAAAAPSLGRDTKGVVEIEIPAEAKK